VKGVRQDGLGEPAALSDRSHGVYPTSEETLQVEGAIQAGGAVTGGTMTTAAWR